MIALKIPPTKGFGATAVVCRGGEQGHAIKLFRRRAQLPLTQPLFENEVQAYELVQAHAKLKPLTPVYYGKTVIDAVTDENGKDVSADFVLDCAFAMEWLDPSTGWFDHVKSYLCEAVRQDFRAVGIWTSDCSVFRDNKDQKILKVIDFGIKDPFV
jgi:hypothetical protein